MPDKKADLEFFNGFGGFAREGREYEIILEGDRRTPAPWINVIANPDFGFTVSETGAGHTWAFNSRENKITPWSNDPVSDPAAEVIYIRDNMTGRVMSTASLGRADGVYRVRHGFGYSVFSHEEGGLAQNLKVFVPVDDPVKVWELELENNAGRELSLTLTYYVEWVLGVDRYHTNPYIVTSFNNAREFLSAENVYNEQYRGYRAFIFSSGQVVGYTGDRQEVFGRGGSIQQPLRVEGSLSNTTGVGLDSCGVIQVSMNLAMGERRKLVFGLGYGKDDDIPALCGKYRNLQEIERAFDAVGAYWERQLGTVQVASSDRAADILLNGWLLYQTIACRMFARTAFYQNGGAFGYRDQLQDAMALVHTRPDMLREQLLIASSRQFPEGDVQHWWHPPTGVGVRTRITDDLLWLPYVTAEYVEATADTGVLSEVTPYIAGPLLAEGQRDMMFTPEVPEETDTLYEHCKRSIARIRLGEHGLPLIGGGDWNDGMDRVGIEGRGESVWLAWFFYAVLDRFMPLAHYMGDSAYAETLVIMKAALKESIDQNAWDGEWYLRAFYDDGSKMGSHENEECRIDSISQSWSILSGAGDTARARQAFDSAWEHLVLQEERVSLLLTPPFDKTEKNPGYIKEYYPGVRENGGQYTHAAIWLAAAAALMGESERSYRLFSMLNPINHTLTREDALVYENEPYVMSADISYRAPWTGRGGWSWYTGSSGWMYQGLLKYFLGLRKEGDSLVLSPCVPAEFGNFTIRYRYGTAVYIIDVKFLADRSADREDVRVKLKDDGQEHHITIETVCSSGKGCPKVSRSLFPSPCIP
ncbi:MAG: hypothetical protein PHP02_04425 [Eubacteriales bacterium]|nr:hypothetical protein [Eubacteriales bacterium]